MDLGEDKKKILNLLFRLTEHEEGLSSSEFETNPQLKIFLDLFGVIKESDNTFKVVSDSAKNFIKSLIIFLDNERSLFTSWNDTDQSQYDGSKFLKYIESLRYKEYDLHDPIKTIKILLLIIKSKVKNSSEPQFLAQFNAKTNRFQLIGGILLEDKTEKEIVRFLNKELSGNKFNSSDLEEIRQLDTLSSPRFSNKQGLVLLYKIIPFFVKLKHSELKLSNLDRWCSLEEMQNSSTEDGVSLQSPFEDYKEKSKFRELLDNLPLSIDKEQDKHETVVSIKTMAEKDLENSSKLNKYLDLEESAGLEFKASARWDVKNNVLNKGLEMVIVKTISGFLNSEGGTLIIGVSDDKKIIGVANDINTLNRKDEDGYMQYLTNLFSEYLGAEHSSSINISFEHYDEKIVCMIEVKKTATPVFVKHKDNRDFYIRYGNTTRLLNSEETYKYLLTRR